MRAEKKNEIRTTSSSRRKKIKEKMVRTYNKTGKYSKKNKYNEEGGDGDNNDDDENDSDFSFGDDDKKQPAVIDESKLTARQRAKLGHSTDFDESLMSLDYGDPRGGMLSSSSRRKRMKMTEEAMRDLNLESMTILFKALDGKREVVVSILGKSDSGRKIISLDNNVNFVAGLPEIIRAYFDFEKLGIDLSKFGFGLNAFEIN